MTMVFVVTWQLCKRASVAGVYTDPHVAYKLCNVIGFDARVTPIELNLIFPGFQAELQEMDNIRNKGLDQLEKNKFEFVKGLPMNQDHIDDWIKSIMENLPRD